MIKQVVDCGFYVLQSRLPGRYRRAIQKRFCARFVFGIEHLHGRQELRDRIAEVGIAAAVRKTRENFGKLANVVVRIGRNRIAIGVEPKRAVRIQLEQPYREQLHDFTGIVLVGKNVVGRIGATVVDMAQVDSHCRMQRDITQQVAKISEGIRKQSIVVVTKRIGIDDEIVDVIGNHEYLAQRERDPLSQRVRCRHGAMPPGESAKQDQILDVLLERRELSGVASLHEVSNDRCVVCDRQSELTIHPLVSALPRKRIDLVEAHAEGCLRREPGCALWIPATAPSSTPAAAGSDEHRHNERCRPPPARSCEVSIGHP